MGLVVYVGNPRKLRLIWDSTDKSGARDARIFGMVCRVEPRLLHPLHHRGRKAQADLTIIKSRDMLVKTRSQLISFANRCESFVPSELRASLGFVFEIIIHLNEQIKKNERQIEQLSVERYPETQYLR